MKELINFLQKHISNQNTLNTLTPMIKAEQDNDSEMGYKHLQGALHHIKEIFSNFDPSQDLPDWIDHKLGVAFEELSDVAHYLDGNMSEDMEKSFHFKAEHKSKEGGLTEKGRKAYNKATGSNLKRPQPEGGKRKKSFCARSKGQMDMHDINCRETPDKRVCLARRRWKC